MTLGTTENAPKEAVYNKTKLFVLSVIALVTAGMVFSLRASALGELQQVFFGAKDPAHAAALVHSATCLSPRRKSVSASRPTDTCCLPAAAFSSSRSSLGTMSVRSLVVRCSRQ